MQAPERDQEHSIRLQLAALNVGTVDRLRTDVYDALVYNEASVRELGDEILAKIAHELTASLRANVSVDWSSRERVMAKLRILV